MKRKIRKIMIDINESSTQDIKNLIKNMDISFANIYVRIKEYTDFCVQTLNMIELILNNSNTKPIVKNEITNISNVKKITPQTIMLTNADSKLWTNKNNPQPKYAYIENYDESYISTWNLLVIKLIQLLEKSIRNNNKKYLDGSNLNDESNKNLAKLNICLKKIKLIKLTPFYTNLEQYSLTHEFKPNDALYKDKKYSSLLKNYYELINSEDLPNNITDNQFRDYSYNIILKILFNRGFDIKYSGPLHITGTLNNNVISISKTIDSIILTSRFINSVDPITNKPIYQKKIIYISLDKNELYKYPALNEYMHVFTYKNSNCANITNINPNNYNLFFDIIKVIDKIL